MDVSPAIGMDKENCAFGEAAVEGHFAVKTPPRLGSGHKKRGALVSITNSPGIRSSTPVRKRQRRASSISKRVSFGGEQIKLYRQPDEEWKARTPSKQNEEALAYDEVAEDTVDMPDIANVLRKGLEEPPQAGEPPSSRAEPVLKVPVFMDDDVAQAIPRRRLSEAFDPEDTETIVLGPGSRRDSDVSEGDITKNIPSLADLIASEDFEKKSAQGSPSDASDSFDRMYGKVFGDDATEEDLTNYTGATNVTMTHNITASVPNLSELLEAENAQVRALAAVQAADDENVTREIPTFARLLEEDSMVNPNPKEGAPRKHDADAAGGPEEPPVSSAKKAVEDKVKRLSESTKGWNAEGTRGTDNGEDATQEITAELADDIFLSNKGAAKRTVQHPPEAQPPATPTPPSEARDDEGRPAFSVKEFLVSANIRFLDEIDSRRQREMSTGDTSGSPPVQHETPADAILAACCTRLAVNLADEGARRLEAETTAIQRRASEVEGSIETRRPQVFRTVEGGEEGGNRDAFSSALVALKRLKNLCRLQARKQWYAWRASHETSTAERIGAEKLRLRADLAALDKATRDLDDAKSEMLADAGVRGLSLGPEPHAVPCDAEVAARARQAADESSAKRSSIAGLIAARKALMDRRDALTAEIQAATRKKEALMEFSASFDHLEAVLSRSSRLNELLTGVTRTHLVEFSRDKLTIDICGAIRASFNLRGPEVSSVDVSALRDGTAYAAVAKVVEEMLAGVQRLSQPWAVRRAASFVVNACAGLSEAEKLGTIVKATCRDGSLVIVFDAVYSRLASRRKFTVTLEQRFSPSARDTLQAIRLEPVIGSAPTVDEVNGLFDERKLGHYSLSVCSRALSKAFL